MTAKQAYQEFFDNAFHRSIKPEISEEAKAVAMVSLQEKIDRENNIHEKAQNFVVKSCENCRWYEKDDECWNGICYLLPGPVFEPDDYCSKFNPKEEPSK